MSTNLMVGIISHIPDTERGLQRIPIHQQQLRWLEDLYETIPFDLFRVESGWGERAKEECTTTIPHESIIVDKHPCGHNRNYLLERFYNSTYNWLFLLDDDRVFYDHYNYKDWFKSLDSSSVLELAQDGYLISCLLPMYEPFKKTNYEYPYRETHWFMDRDSLKGSLQSCFIPNIVKLNPLKFMKGIYFDNETSAQMGEAPEDVEFQIDWIKAGGRCIRNRNLIAKEIGQAGADKSMIYNSLEERREIEKGHDAWLRSYLQKIYPRRPQLWTRRAFNDRYNPKSIDLIPRTERYIFKDNDLPRNIKNPK